MTEEEISELSDTELTRIVAVEVMGWKYEGLHLGEPHYYRPEVNACNTVYFKPLTDANDRDRVVERLREVWEQYFKDTGKARGWVIKGVAGLWRAEIWENCEIQIHVLHANPGRAICEAALLDGTSK